MTTNIEKEDELNNILDKSLNDCLDLLSDIEIERNGLEDKYSKSNLLIIKSGIREDVKDKIYNIIDKFWENMKPENKKIVYQCSICLLEIEPNHGTLEHLDNRIKIDYISPCACSGFNKYIHTKCYRELMIHGTYKCNVCKMDYPSYSRYSYF